jgi:undecaprenyl-diphosphatase
MARQRTGNSDSIVTRWVQCIVFAVLFAAVAYLVTTGKTLALDMQIQSWVFSLRSGALTSFAKIVTLGGETKVVAVICVVLVLLPQRMKIGLPIALMTGVGSVIQRGLKVILCRPRPDAVNWLVPEDGFSFPSGHTNSSFILYLAVAIIVGRLLIAKGHPGTAALLRIVLPVFAVLVALSRPYLGVHYPSDILGGWLLGTAVLILSFLVYDQAWPAKWRIGKK